MNYTNQQIITQLAEHARQYFDALDVTPGTYTAAELADNCRSGDKLKRPIYCMPADADAELFNLYASEPITIAFANFVCEIPREQVFRYLWKFEQLENTTTKKKTRFTRDIVAAAACYVTIPQEAAGLAKFVAGKAMLPPQFKYIYLDFKNSTLVASDNTVLTECPITIEGAENIDTTPSDVFINPKHIKSLIGRTRVQLVVTDRRMPDCSDRIVKAIFTNERGEIFENEYAEGRYPNYRRLYKPVCPEGYIKITPEGVKTADKFFKSVAKLAEPKIVLNAEKGNCSVSLTYCDPLGDGKRVASLPLAAPARISFRLALHGKQCATSLATWNGGIWCTDARQALIFDSCAFPLILMMPAFHQDAFGQIHGETCPLLERAKFIEGAPPVAIPYVALEEVPEISTENMPEKAAATSDEAPESAPETSESVSEASDEVTEYIPETPAKVQIIAFVDWLAAAVDIVAKSFYRMELAKTLERARRLAELAGVDIAELAPNLCKSAPDVPATPPEAPAIAEPPKASCSAPHSEAVDVEPRPEPVAGTPPRHVAAWPRRAPLPVCRRASPVPLRRRVPPISATAGGTTSYAPAPATPPGIAPRCRGPCAS